MVYCFCCLMIVYSEFFLGCMLLVLGFWSLLQVFGYVFGYGVLLLVQVLGVLQVLSLWLFEILTGFLFWF